MRQFLFASILLLCTAACQAQDVPKAELFTGYAYQGFSFASAALPGSPVSALNGINISATGNVNRLFGLTADFGGYYGSATTRVTFTPPNCNLCLQVVDTTLHHMYTFMAGPQISFRGPKATLYGHALFGGAQISADRSGLAGGSGRLTGTDFAAAVGAGVDVNLTPLVALRFQPDYVLTRFFGASQNNFRFSTGVVFRFGGEPHP